MHDWIYNYMFQYRVLPDFTQVHQSGTDIFTQAVERGRVDWRGYCPLTMIEEGPAYFDRYTERIPLTIFWVSSKSFDRDGQEQLFETPGSGRIVHYRNEVSGQQENILVHKYVVGNDDLAGLTGFKLRKGILVREREFVTPEQHDVADIA